MTHDKIICWRALPPAEFERLSPHLELVAMPLGEVLYESGSRLRHVYFPITSIVPLLYVLTDGASAEIAVVGNEGILTMTQELIANMLGVRREGVTEAARKLQNAGLIHYRRGRMTVIDRAGLEARACECYAVVKKEVDVLLRDPIAN
jgi:CRP-like cAMP-binding protein